jgi:ubiquitin C-terminal hydrolase
MRTVGLSNQGATCYLNALLKILFAVPAFTNAVFENSSESQILLALQHLFALLLHSRREAVSTKELTTAFGWTRSDVFEQHDALELFALLIDVIERESSNPDVTMKIFKGTSTGLN